MTEMIRNERNEEVAKTGYFRTINMGNVREICVGF